MDSIHDRSLVAGVRCLCTYFDARFLSSGKNVEAMQANVFTIGHAKDAALLYEGVVCLIPDEISVEDLTLKRKILESLAPSKMKSSFCDYLDIYFENDAVAKLKSSIKENKFDIWNIFSLVFDKSFYPLLTSLSSVFNESKELTLDFFVKRNALKKSEKSSLSVNLLDIDLIDTENVSWEAILEVRKDPDAFRKIRQFRQFLISDMTGKTKNEVHDELLLLLENYRLTAQANELKLQKGRFQTIIPKVGPVAGITLVTALTGTPFSWAALGAASFGYLCDLGQGKLELSKKEVEFKLGMDLNPITHLMSLQEVGALKI